ncbi:synaptic vesicle glycoprotein 2B-like isoform X2 [Cimex lectularius]|uniref:Major facilitator superfamily (MFS) profile domain-containing protein n=1 Tax=Cimex lectularius TaxID=79782 RepID=A0A8I6RI40_CIMLE|nr:synaptic vesicle glycoprotein 2B-like isoform X2 [Cimex lectularius]
MGALPMEPLSSLSPSVYPVKPLLNQVTLEEALEAAGNGKFQRYVALIGSICFLAGGFQNSLNAYILPSIKCDMGISSSEMGLLNAGFLAGALCSGFLSGVLVDNIGRKPILVAGMFLDGICTLIASTAQSFGFLLVFRSLSGFLVGGPSAVVLTYVGEFHSNKNRNQVLCFVGVAWMVSWVLLPLISMAVIPLDFNFNVGSFNFNSWKLLVALFACPSLISSAFLFKLPESPKFLVINGQHDKALKELVRIYTMNTGFPGSNFSVISLEKNTDEMKLSFGNKSIWKPLLIMVKQCKSLFFGPTLPIISLTNFLFFANMFGYYGLGLWLPELINRFQTFESEHPNATISVCEASQLKLKTVYDCGSSSVSSVVFGFSLIMGAASLVGNIASGLLIPKLPRPMMPVFFMTISSFCVLLLYYVKNSVQNLIVSAVFQLCIGSSNIVYNALVVDMFPNEIREIFRLLICFSVPNDFTKS